MEQSNQKTIEQKMATTFRVKHEDREYSLSFPGDAHLQELWDFLQACAGKVMEASKRNAEALGLSPDGTPKVDTPENANVS